MLTLLSLKDFVIVPELSLEAGEGLTCLTGETGAGKSILIDALELVLGARSDASLIREGAERTEVTAEFSSTSRAKAWLEAAGLDIADAVLLRRTVDIKGRSRCWVNGTPVTVAQIKEIGERLVDIHGQHAHQSLLKPAHQLQLVDGFGATKPLLAAVKSAWDKWQNALRRLKEATEDKERLQAEAERLSWMKEVLDELAPREGEYQSVSEEHALLSNSADIVTSIRTALECLRDSENNAARLVLAAQNELTSVQKYDDRLAGYIDSLAEAGTVIEETARDIAHELDRFDTDDEHFSELDDRLNAYWQISRKFHRAPEEIYALWQETTERLKEIEESADIDALKLTETDTRRAFTEEAKKLTQAREAAAKKLSDAVTEKMQTLAMEGGCLKITLPASEPWAGGLERCEFLVAGHTGATPRPLTKVASGGELARISLAIAVITAEITPVPTLIFDEVDTGIGGAVAEVVGRLLRRLGESRQVLCITHLPQVASCANHQWRVEKHAEGAQTVSHLSVLSEKERIEEIARMLGGVTLTDATRKTAREMLQNARIPPQK